MKNRKVFIDSNIFIAFFVKDDTSHEDALDLWSKLKEEEAYLLTSDLVISEVLTVLRLKAGKKVSIKFGDIVLEKSDVLNIIPITSKLMTLSYEVFKEVKNKDFSFVDASIIAIGKEFNIEIITFDKILDKVITIK
ncbi:MAG: PIN domain-containing protein [Candidatus Paceibacterota bacterium]